MYKIVLTVQGNQHMVNGSVEILSTNNIALRSLLYDYLQKRIYENSNVQFVEL